MSRYILKRLLMIIPVIVGVSFVIYFIVDLAPGDALLIISPEADSQALEQMRHMYGYDRSVFYRYFLYMKNLLQGDLGTSIIYNQSVFQLYIQRLPATLLLAIGSVIVAHIISIPLGILSATHAGSVLDNVSVVLALVGMSMPHFWFGLLLIILFSLNLGWFPSSGFTGFSSLVLPAITVATGLMALLTRTTRSSMIDVIRQEYLRTARSKGVSERSVILKHALRNALIPIITVSGTQFAGILGGSVVTETIFSWPGIGRLIIDAVKQRDTPLVTGGIMMTTILVSLLLLIVDIIYAFVDPRIKSQYASGRKKHE